jgi:transposase
VRTSLPAETLGDADTVRSYKSLARVERAFRCIKTVDLNVRPVYHWLEDRVRAHVLLCMLAYYLEWHMRQCLAPMLFDDTYKDDTYKEEAEALLKKRPKPCAAAWWRQRSVPRPPSRSKRRA